LYGNDTTTTIAAVRRTLPLVIALGLLLPTGHATASVERAQQEADAAEGVLDDAAAEADAARRQHLERLDEMAGFANDYRRITRQLEALAFRMSEARIEIEDIEAEVRGHRRAARERTVHSYITGGDGLLDLFLAAGSLEEVATGRQVLAIATARDLDLADDLGTALADLEELRQAYEDDGEAMELLQWQADRAIGQASLLVAAAASTVSSKEATAAEADLAYQAALVELEEAIAYRNAIGPSVEKWRPLVEEHFPADLVDQALAVMRCESWGNPFAVNPYSGASGLFQFMAGTWAWTAPAAGYAGVDRFDPEANVASAAYLVDYSIRTGHRNGAWGRWSCQP
jgi:tetratricopeptide (TPR) repeat protein